MTDFKTEIHYWVNSLKHFFMENLNPAAFDYAWTEFKNWFNYEAMRIKDLSYEFA